MKPLVKTFSMSTLCLVGLIFVAAQTGGCLIPSNDPMPADVPDVEDPPPDDVDAGPLPDDVDPDGPGPDGGPVATVPAAYADAAFSPDGRFVLRQALDADGQGCLSVADLEEWKVDHLEDVCNLRWIEFSPDGAVAYLLEVSGNAVTALKLDDLSTEEVYETSDIYSTMDVSPDGESLVLTNKPTTDWSESQYEWNTYDMDLRHLGIVRPSEGAVHEQTFPFAIRSVAFSPVDGAVLVAMSWWKEDGLPEAQVHFMNPASGVVEDDITFPNCADEVAVQPEGTLAILSPNQCFVHPIILAPPEVEEEWPPPEDEWEEWEDWDDADPASVIDLTTREFVGNLPGFGTVQFSPDGETAVAFSRQETMMKQWNMFQKRAVGLILIRLEDLYWKVVDYGDDEPDYFIDPSGDHLYLHDEEPGHDRIVRLDLATDAMAVLEGPPTHLDDRSLAPDGAAIYVVAESQLRRVPVGGAAIEPMPLPFTPSQVFARPQGDALAVTETGNAAVHLVNPADGAVLSSIDL